ncbi:DUF433 domain-containing protein [Benzoatithermus flavus]|uniref:DUF433 domain-containing protein n=1 Tax=Benzoatithermus flavus TaxID=3108223 RepID=A0ABU8XYH2_9PROT
MGHGAVRDRRARPRGDEGGPCFRGACVPIAVLSEKLAASMTVAEILGTWLDPDREDVLAVLELVAQEVARHAKAV